MNTKLIVIGIAVLLLVGGGVLFRTTFAPEGSVCTRGQGSDVEIHLVAKENKWEFDPPQIEVKKCDRVTLHVENEDEYDHGFAIDVFGVNKRLTPKSTTSVTFTASQSGEFVFYCSVPCGEGHLRHKGKIVVFDIVGK